MINAEAIGKNIRRLRKERNISQEKMEEDDMWRGFELTLAAPDSEILYFSFTDNYDEPKFFCLL